MKKFVKDYFDLCKGDINFIRNHKWFYIATFGLAGLIYGFACIKILIDERKERTEA